MIPRPQGFCDARTMGKHMGDMYRAARLAWHRWSLAQFGMPFMRDGFEDAAQAPWVAGDPS